MTTKRESMSDCSQATKPQQPVADANSLGMHAGGDGFKELQEVYSVGKDGDNARLVYFQTG